MRRVMATHGADVACIQLALSLSRTSLMELRHVICLYQRFLKHSRGWHCNAERCSQTLYDEAMHKTLKLGIKQVNKGQISTVKRSLTKLTFRGLSLLRHFPIRLRR